MFALPQHHGRIAQGASRGQRLGGPAASPPLPPLAVAQPRQRVHRSSVAASSACSSGSGSDSSRREALLAAVLAAGALVSAQPAQALQKNELKFTDIAKGTGEQPKAGDLVLVDLVGKLPNGTVFLDTRKAESPIAFQLGRTNKYIPPGVTQVVQGMARGSVRVATVPSSLGYGDQSVVMPGGATVPPGAELTYEVELLQCQSFTLGLACCNEDTFQKNGGKCVQNPPQVEAIPSVPSA